MKHRLLALLLVAAGVACAGEHEFDRVVHAVEHHYGVKRTSIPFLGLANFFVKIARPAGTSGFRLAVWEDLPSAPTDNQADLDRLMNEVASGRLHPLVVTRSRRDGESSYILAGEIGKSTDLLIANFERHEATVIEVTVNLETLLKMLASPDHAHQMFEDRHSDDDGGR